MWMIILNLVVGTLIWLIYSFSSRKLKGLLGFVMMIVLTLWGLASAGVLTKIFNT